MCAGDLLAHCCGILPHAERALKVIGVQQVFGNTSAGFIFGMLFFGAFRYS